VVWSGSPNHPMTTPTSSHVLWMLAPMFAPFCRSEARFCTCRVYPMTLLSRNSRAGSLNSAVGQSPSGLCAPQSNTSLPALVSQSSRHMKRLVFLKTGLPRGQPGLLVLMVISSSSSCYDESGPLSTTRLLTGLISLGGRESLHEWPGSQRESD